MLESMGRPSALPHKGHRLVLGFLEWGAPTEDQEVRVERLLVDLVDKLLTTGFKERRHLQEGTALVGRRPLVVGVEVGRGPLRHLVPRMEVLVAVAVLAAVAVVVVIPTLEEGVGLWLI